MSQFEGLKWCRRLTKGVSYQVAIWPDEENPKIVQDVQVLNVEDKSVTIKTKKATYKLTKNASGELVFTEGPNTGMRASFWLPKSAERRVADI